jgi:hypothetical protein
VKTPILLELGLDYRGGGEGVGWWEMETHVVGLFFARKQLFFNRMLKGCDGREAVA